MLETRHINVHVEAYENTYEVDLQLFADLRPSRSSACAVDDNRAFAGLYSNAGVFRLADGDRAGALTVLERAVAIDPTYAAGWSNLGAAYLLAGEAERARGCYERALAEKADSMAAISGLARIHREAGRIGAAERLERAVMRYRERNPYFLFTMAREAMDAGRLDSYRGYLVRAIRIKGDEPEFYELAVAVARGLGRTKDVARWSGRLEALRAQQRMAVVAGR